MRAFLHVAFDIFVFLFFVGGLSSIACVIVYIVKLIKHSMQKQKATIILFIVSLIITACSYVTMGKIDNYYKATYHCFMDDEHMVVDEDIDIKK